MLTNAATGSSRQQGVRGGLCVSTKESFWGGPQGRKLPRNRLLGVRELRSADKEQCHLSQHIEDTALDYPSG
eukprot:4323951-Amphidinium_carterae.1